MNIGIDIDNVISDFDEQLLKEYLKYDKKLRNTGITNKDAAYIKKGMFDWTKEEDNFFYNNNIQRIVENLKTITNASKFIKKISELGNKIFIITGRNNGEYKEPYNMTKKWLLKNNIIYDELILTNSYKPIEKADICIAKNIDIIIDDSIHVCEECSNKGINSLLFSTLYNKHEQRFKRVNNWIEIYRYIKNYKINVILDTDAYNECDDQFALSYLIKSQDKFNIEAITIAPYSHNSKRKVTAYDSQNLSYQEVLKICNWLRFDTINRVFKGSTDYIENGYYEDTDAVNKIIEIALKNDKTYIMAIGAITNVALAIIKEPKIINKLEVIWLGGNDLNHKDNFEYNFRQDISAVKIVFKSKIKLTIIPCEDVASILKISINDLKIKLKKKTKLNKYLIDQFYNDGYHEIQESRVIWDISVIAYLINKNWFDSKICICPNIKDDTSYECNDSDHNINFIIKINRDKIYEDLFKRIGGK